jgi:hypothetical protein
LSASKTDGTIRRASMALTEARVTGYMQATGHDLLEDHPGVPKRSSVNQTPPNAAYRLKVEGGVSFIDPQVKPETHREGARGDTKPER